MTLNTGWVAEESTPDRVTVSNPGAETTIQITASVVLRDQTPSVLEYGVRNQPSVDQALLVERRSESPIRNNEAYEISLDVTLVDQSRVLATVHWYFKGNVLLELLLLNPPAEAIASPGSVLSQARSILTSFQLETEPSRVDEQQVTDRFDEHLRNRPSLYYALLDGYFQIQPCEQAFPPDIRRVNPIAPGEWEISYSTAERDFHRWLYFDLTDSFLKTSGPEESC